MFEQRQEIETNLITQHVGLQVSGVDDVVLSDGIKILQDLLTTDTEQRTDDVAVSGTDARQSVDAGTTEEVHEQRLYGIVTMVSYTDRLSSDVVAQLTEITIAQFACSHLNAYLMQRCVFGCIKVD